MWIDWVYMLGENNLVVGALRLLPLLVFSDFPVATSEFSMSNISSFQVLPVSMVLNLKYTHDNILTSFILLKILHLYENVGIQRKK